MGTSFRVTLSDAQREKLQRISRREGFDHMTDYVRNWIEKTQDPLDISYKEFCSQHKRIVDKLQFWTGQRIFPQYNFSKEGQAAVAQEVKSLIEEVVFCSDQAKLKRNMKRLDKILTYQEKTTLGMFFPFHLEQIQGYASGLKFFTKSNWYNLQDGEYIILDEPVNEEFNWNGECTGLITINKYNALVLNAHTMMIVDVDLDSSQGCFDDNIITPYESVALSALKVFQAQNADKYKSFRVYRTAGGLRYILTSNEINPKQSHQAFKALFADPKYSALCSFQETFRARLTAKPWRMEGCWGYKDYLNYADEYRVCQLIDVVGDGTTLDKFKPMIEAHDNMTGADCYNDHLMLV